MPNLTPGVTDEMVEAFDGPKSSNMWVREGLANAVPIVQRDVLRELRKEFMREQPQGLGSPELIDRFAREHGVAV